VPGLHCHTKNLLEKIGLHILESLDEKHERRRKYHFSVHENSRQDKVSI
jgi:hypothetical protein